MHYLPAQHETVTITQYRHQGWQRQRSQPGAGPNDNGRSGFPVRQVLPRVWRGFSRLPAGALVNTVGIMSGSTSPGNCLDPAIDIEAFFNKESRLQRHHAAAWRKSPARRRGRSFVAGSRRHDSRRGEQRPTSRFLPVVSCIYWTPPTRSIATPPMPGTKRGTIPRFVIVSLKSTGT